MEEARFSVVFDAVADRLFRHWRLMIVAAWLLYLAVIITGRWTQIQAFALPDTDDNLTLFSIASTRPTAGATFIGRASSICRLRG